MIFKEKKKYFDSIYEQMKSRIGQEFKILKEINTPDKEHDEEVLPMYLIEFPDGEQIEVWPEEIFDDI